MRGFLRRSTVDEALAWLDAQFVQLPPETVRLRDAAGRVLHNNVTSHVSIPGFARAMMDGYAVRAEDTIGATLYNRLPLDVIGQSLPGRPFAGCMARGQAVRIMTGAPLPAGADAVLPAEISESSGSGILAHDAVSPDKHVSRPGEDIPCGTVVLESGRRLRPQDLGVLSSIGMAEVSVLRRPRVRIVVTGNELLPAGTQPHDCQIADANGPMLEALVARDGGLAVYPGIVPDDPEQILRALRHDAEIVLVSGGSSVGQEDYVPRLLAEHGELSIHGVAMRPSSPTGMGRLDGRTVFLLPGNPVSCLCAYDFFAGRAIRVQAGLSKEWPYRRLKAPLKRKLVSTVGRVDYARVTLDDGQVEPLAISGASILSSTTRADGFVVIPADREGFPPGAEVEVFLYDAMCCS
jgi:molybdopterin molybdotransferase